MWQIKYFNKFRIELNEANFININSTNEYVTVRPPLTFNRTEILFVDVAKYLDFMFAKYLIRKNQIMKKNTVKSQGS